METTTLWIILIVIAALSILFIRFVAQTTVSQNPPDSVERNAVDVFGESRWSILLSVVLGSGIQNAQTLAPLIASLIPVLIGLKSLAYNTVISEAITVFHLSNGVSAAYAGVVLCNTMKGKEISSNACWITIAFSTALLSCGTIYFMKSIIEIDSVEISLHTARVASVWLCVSIAATMLGGYFGSKARPIRLPVLVSRNEGIDISEGSNVENRSRHRLVLVAGYLASMITASEICFVLMSSWHMISVATSVSLVVILVLVIVSVCCSWMVLIRSLLLAPGESKFWWWKPFFAFGGPLAIHATLRAMRLPLLGLKISSWLESFAVDFSVSIILGLFVMITGGALGFLFVFRINPPLLGIVKPTFESENEDEHETTMKAY